MIRVNITQLESTAAVTSNVIDMRSPPLATSSSEIVFNRRRCGWCGEQLLFSEVDDDGEFYRYCCSIHKDLYTKYCVASIGAAAP